MNESGLSKGNGSQNLQTLLDFLTSVNHLERFEIVNQCCIDRRDHYFSDKDPMALLKAEIVQNGFGNIFFPEDKLDVIIESRLNTLKKRLSDESWPIPLDNAELLAILVYTHEK